MGTRISAVVCTWNRAAYLRKAVRSLSEQTLPEEDFEILVVDNGSTDGTRQVVLEESSGIGNLRYIHEPTLGLSHARNAGWRSARGAYVAYLDDDAVACPKWLHSILESFETVKPRPGCVGGKVEPHWEAPRPAWLPDRMLAYLSLLDLSDKPIILSQSQSFYGTNMAIPRELLERIGGFDTALGRRGHKLLSNEEVLLKRKIEGLGLQCLYSPFASVAHQIPALRLTRRWFLRRFFWQGASGAIMRIEDESLSIWWRARLAQYRFRTQLLSRQVMAALAPARDSPDRFLSQCRAVQQVGYILGLLGLAR